jgi:hypothetical protein
MGDLCWVRRVQPRPDATARTSIRAYLLLAKSSREGHEALWQVDDAGRALDLAREIRDPRLASEAEQVLLDLADKELGQDEPAPGVLLRALEPLGTTRSSENYERFDELLTRSARVFEADPWSFEAIAEIMANVIAPESRSQLHVAVVQCWERAADEAGAANGFAHRQHALELAKVFGLGEEAHRLRVQLQEQDLDSMGFASVRHEGRLQGVDELISSVVSSSFVDSFLQLASCGPPSGDPQANVAAVEEFRRLAPLQAAIPRTLLSAVGNATVWHAPPGTPARDRYDLAKTEQFRIRYNALLFVQVFREARRRFGDPSEAQLQAALTTAFIDGVTAERLAHGITLVMTGDFDAGVHVLLPRIEAVIRQLVRATGQPITTEPRGDAPGGVRPLGGLLDQLKGKMDEGWRRYLVNALVDPLGINLRNRAMHGLMDAASESEAALALHIVAVLASLEPDIPPASETGSLSNDAPSERSQGGDPTSGRAGQS